MTYTPSAPAAQNQHKKDANSAAALQPALRLRALLTALVLLAVAGNAKWLAPEPPGRVFPQWQASQWWLDYQNGFIRRGLPGEVLSLIVGGTPTATQAKVAGVLISAAAITTGIGLAVLLLRRASLTAGLAVVVTVLLVSPLGASIVVHDMTRYDDFGIVALFLLALPKPRHRLNPWLAAGAIGALVALVTAAQEFLFVVVLPAAVLRVLIAVRDGEMLDRAWRPRRSEWPYLAVALLPGMVLLLFSQALIPTQDQLRSASGAAATAGVYPTATTADGITVLANGLREEIQFIVHLGPKMAGIWLVIFGGFYLVTTVLLRRLVPGVPARAFWVCAGFAGFVALGLSVVGADYRRWWALALFMLLACVALLRRPGAPPVNASRGLLMSGVAVAALSLPVNLLNVYPSW